MCEEIFKIFKFEKYDQIRRAYKTQISIKLRFVCVQECLAKKKKLF